MLSSIISDGCCCGCLGVSKRLNSTITARQSIALRGVTVPVQVCRLIGVVRDLVCHRQVFNGVEVLKEKKCLINSHPTSQQTELI